MAARAALVDSVQDHVCRTRPLCVWTAMKGGNHYNTTQWLIMCFPVMKDFRDKYPILVAACQPVAKRIVQSQDALMFWLQSGDAAMALRRAQFLITFRAFGHYAPHRVSFAWP